MIQENLSGKPAPIDRETEHALYEDILRQQYQDPELIFRCAGTWSENRVRVDS